MTKEITYYYSTGLNCRIGKRITMTKIECAKNCGTVTLTAVSGRDLSKIPGVATVVMSLENYEKLGGEYSDSTEKAIALMRELGLAISEVVED